jgi:hypothetical protein
MEQILFTISSLLIVIAAIFAIFLKYHVAALYLFAGALALKIIKEIFIKDDWISATTTFLFMCLILFFAMKGNR